MSIQTMFKYSAHFVKPNNVLFYEQKYPEIIQRNIQILKDKNLLHYREVEYPNENELIITYHFYTSDEYYRYVEECVNPPLNDFYPYNNENNILFQVIELNYVEVEIETLTTV